MRCESCERDVVRLDHGRDKDGNVVLLCVRCKRKPICDRCGKRVNRVTLQDQGFTYKHLCGPCNKAVCSSASLRWTD